MRPERFSHNQITKDLTFSTVRVSWI